MINGDERREVGGEWLPDREDMGVFLSGIVFLLQGVEFCSRRSTRRVKMRPLWENLFRGLVACRDSHGRIGAGSI